MTAGYPVVYHSTTLADLILYLLNQHAAPSLTVVCTSQDEFLKQLLASIEANSLTHTGSKPHAHPDESSHADQSAPAAQNPKQQAQEPPQTGHALLNPTLGLLAQSHTMRLSFVTSVPALHAYLSTISEPPSTTGAGPLKAPSAPTATQKALVPTLAVLGAVALHRGTAAFSAQGLGRAFAAVVEAGWEARMRVVCWEGWTIDGEVDGRGLGAPRYGDAVGEAVDPLGVVEDGNGDVSENEESERAVADVHVGADFDVNMHDSSDASDTSMSLQANDPLHGEDGGCDNVSVWDGEVPILNAATKTFGPAGERRGWRGRTVRVGDVVGRWFAFEELPGPQKS